METERSQAVNSLDNTSRKSGILVHPTSFPSDYGIGDLGCGAYHFIDFLERSKQKIWQILPLGPTGYGDSPYQSFSSFAGQPLIISPNRLKDMGLLKDDDLSNKPFFDPRNIDYGPLIQYKNGLLRKAYGYFKECTQATQNAFNIFCEKESLWLDDYALFMACKDYHDGRMWTLWEDEIARPTDETKKRWADKLQNDVVYYKFLQFIFYKQWFELKQYANDRGIQIIGDIPIFVAFDSSDVWANNELFYLDSKGNPTSVAGVPPDYFSATGQLWGNPLYRWEAHQKDGYQWWINRVSYSLKLVDILRIDHFRGFEAYWAIPYGAENAINGEWQKGPSKDLFNAFIRAFGKALPIIAEDLGVITPEVEDLRDSFNLPGMKILQFGFENIEENQFLPHHYITHSVCYSGTHDNDTSLGWYNKASEQSKDKVRRYMNTDANSISWDFIRTCFGSASETAVVPLQDVMELDSEARMNIPGVAAGNWKWRYTYDMLGEHLSCQLKCITELYGRG